MNHNLAIDPKLLSVLRGGADILCVSHVAPDGDAIGSLLGMGWILRCLGKNPTLALQDPVPVEHLVLPGASAIVTSDSAQFETAVRQHRFDVIVCLDASSADRMGATHNPSVHDLATLAVIDHHITNTRFGDVNWVATECAATCQMLVYLADALGVPVQNELAECLLTGLVTDTLAFSTSSTTPGVLGTAMRLMQGGADLTSITQRTINRRPFSVIKLWGTALAGVHLEEGVIWTAVTLQDTKRAGNGTNDIRLSSFLVTADEADISAVFTEKLDANGNVAVECSFRAKPGFDVSAVAFSLGGGGHPAASGCTIPGPLPDAIARVIPTLKAARRNSTGSNGAKPDSA